MGKDVVQLAMEKSTGRVQASNNRAQTAQAQSMSSRGSADGRVPTRGHRVKIEVHPDDDLIARKAAVIIAVDARAAVPSRGRFIMAASGGRTPWLMLRALADEQLPWENVHVVQVDERAAPTGDPAKEGGPAIEETIFSGFSVNVTLLFSREHYLLPPLLTCGGWRGASKLA
jgi:Glucosamine-6-phosphate isomerases/6-phosphogluconolactonase